MKSAWIRYVCAAGALAMTALAAPQTNAGPVTSDDLVKAQDNRGEWLMYGRDYRNWRYSPLAEITPENVANLKPVWAMSTGGQFGGLEATPLYRDGVLYFSADYGRVFAVDAKSGNIIWHYEPEYEQGFNAMLCCGPIHRGVALTDDLVISDVGMGPGMNGWELVARIRQAWPAMRVVLATGWGAAIDSSEARTKGVDAVIAKPYRPADLESLLARLTQPLERPNAA